MFSAAGGKTLAEPVEVEELRWKRLLKTALPTEPLRVRFMLLVSSTLLLVVLSLMLLVMVKGKGNLLRGNFRII